MKISEKQELGPMTSYEEPKIFQDFEYDFDTCDTMEKHVSDCWRVCDVFKYRGILSPVAISDYSDQIDLKADIFQPITAPTF